MSLIDAHTGYEVRSDLCTGCFLCVAACSSIKQDVYSFANSHSFIEITAEVSAASFTASFTSDCDGCSYCLKLCAFEAIGKPEGWVKAPHLAAVTRQHRERRQARIASAGR